MDIPTALAHLDLTPDATEAEATQAFRDLIRVWHPDNFAAKPELLERATTKTKLINEAWATLNAARTRAPGRPSPTSRPPVAPWMIPTAVFLGVLVLGGSLGGWALASDLFNPELRLEKDLAARAWGTNRHLPVNLDDETTLKAVFAGPGLRFTYVYQVVHYTKDQVGQSYFDSVREGLRKGFRSHQGAEGDLKFFSRNNITLDYSFKDKNGADILTMEFLPADYSGN